LRQFQPVFTAPGFVAWVRLVSAWVRCQPADAALVVRIRAAASAALEFPGDLRPLL